jgi:tetratricopeptide (TPR) repeat protein
MKHIALHLLCLACLLRLSAQSSLPARFELTAWLEMEAELPGVESPLPEWRRLLQHLRDELRVPASIDSPEAASDILRQMDLLLTDFGMVYRSSSGRGLDVLVSPALTPADLSAAQRQALLDFDPNRFQAEQQRRSNLWRLGQVEPTPAQQQRLKLRPDAAVYFADCDRLSVLYWALGQALDFPLEFVPAPRHAFVRWRFADGTHLNWEATNGSSPPDRFYETMPGNSPEAIARGSYLRALSDAELWGYWLAMRAQVYLLHGNVDSARKDLEQSLSLFPANPVAWNRLGLLEESAGRSEAALKAFAEGLQHDPSQASLWFNRARMHAENERFAECIEDLREALRLDPRHDGAWSVRADLFQRSGRLPQALQDYSHALELNPDNLSALTGRSNVLRALGRPQQALEDSERAHRLDPDNHVHLGNRALALFLLGRVEEGITDLDKAIAISPAEKLLYANRAALHAHREDYAAAIADYSRVLELDPRFASAYKGRAAAYQHLGQEDAARADLKSLRRLAPAAP